MSRRENRKRYGDGPRIMPERKVTLFCTGHTSHERWNLGYVLILDESGAREIKFRPKSGGTYTHRWTREDRRKFNMISPPDDWRMPDGRPIGQRVNFACRRCSLNLPLRSPLWHRLAGPLADAGVTELDVSIVDIREIM